MILLAIVYQASVTGSALKSLIGRAESYPDQEQRHPQIARY